MKKFPILFGGGLGLLDIEPVKIELQPGAKPYKGKYYSTPKAYVNPLKKAIEDFCVQKILRNYHTMMIALGLYQALANPRKQGLSDYKLIFEK